MFILLSILSSHGCCMCTHEHPHISSHGPLKTSSHLAVRIHVSPILTRLCCGRTPSEVVPNFPFLGPNLHSKEILLTRRAMFGTPQVVPLIRLSPPHSSSFQSPSTVSLPSSVASRLPVCWLSSSPPSRIVPSVDLVIVVLPSLLTPCRLAFLVFRSYSLPGLWPPHDFHFACLATAARLFA